MINMSRKSFKCYWGSPRSPIYRAGHYSIMPDLFAALVLDGFLTQKTNKT